MIQASFLREIIKPSLKRVHKVGCPIDFVKMRSTSNASIALLDDPTYTKALERRASSNETISTWTSLTAAQEGDHCCPDYELLDRRNCLDYNSLLKLVTSPSQLTDIRRKLQLLKPLLESAQKKETDEMMDKLKGLGNSLLGMLLKLILSF